MLTLREFSAWITSEGKPIQEYLVAVDANANKVSCWIPSEAGKNFSVHWRDEVPGRFLYGYGEAWREGVRTGSNTERPFVFTEQANISSGGTINTHAGTIGLKIRRVAIEGSRPANEFWQLPKPSASQNDMLSHCISYGEQRQTFPQSPQTWKVKPYDGSDSRTYVTFVFRYRSREFLLSQGIMLADDALQIPPAVNRACAMNRRVTSASLPVGSAALGTPRPTPSPQNKDNLEQMESALQEAFTPGSVTIRPVTNVQTVSAKAPSHQDCYPGESILDLGVDPNILRM